jgi:hypothetical protein
MKRPLIGKTPGGKGPRLLNMNVEGSEVHISIFPPDPKSKAGWDIRVSLNDFRAALVEEKIVGVLGSI